MIDAIPEGITEDLGADIGGGNYPDDISEQNGGGQDALETSEPSK